MTFARRRKWTPSEAAGWWRRAVAHGLSLAREGEPEDVPGESLTELRRCANAALHPPFPAPGASAELAAQGYLRLAKAVGVCGAPDRRAAMMPALAATAALLETLMAAAQADAARSWQSRLAPEAR